MSLRDDLGQELDAIPAVQEWWVGDSVYHGQKAKHVIVVLLKEATETTKYVQTVEGIFTVEDKQGFGGVEFSQRKPIPELMASKVRSVLAGTAE